MTITDTRPSTDTGGGAPPAPAELTGLARILTSADHKVIGRLFIVGALLMGAAAGVVGVVLGAERVNGDVVPAAADPGLLDILDVDSFAQTFTFHSVTGVLLFVVPLFVGIAAVVVPLQIGARTVAFPRGLMASFWAWLVGAGVLIASYVANGGPYGGDVEAVDLFLTSLGLVVVALTVAAVSLATTVLTLRTSGMTLRRVPAFAFSVLAGATVWILTLAVGAATVWIVFLDHRWGTRTLGANVSLYDQIRWLFGPPAAYAFTLPAVGFAVDAVVTASGARVRPWGMALAGVGGVAALAFSPLTHPFTGGMADDVVGAGYAFATVLPALVLVAAAGDCLRRGTVRLSATLLWGLLTLVVLVEATLVGAAAAIDPFELDLAPHWLLGHSHTILVGLGLLGGLGALHHWSPKIFGRLPAEGGARAAFGLAAVGAVVLVTPDLVSGVAQAVDPDGVADLIEAMNAVSAVGGAILLLGVAAWLATLVASAPGPDGVPANPVGGVTLEWATASPPSPLNFDGDVPEVTSEAPLADDTPSSGTSEATA